MKFKFGANDDNGAAGIVDAFTEEILTETALFTLKHIGKGFKGTIAGSSDRSAPPAIINKRVNSLLLLYATFDEP